MSKRVPLPCKNCGSVGYQTVRIGDKYLIACRKCGRTFANAQEAQKSIKAAKKLWNEKVSNPKHAAWL